MKRGLAVAWIVLLLAGTQLAADDHHLIQYRQHVMKSLAGHSGALKAIADGRVALTGHARMHLDALREGLRVLPDLFPPGSAGIESRAKPAIWEERARFESLARDALRTVETATRALQRGDPDTFAEAVVRIGRGCRDCHRPFREKR